MARPRVLPAASVLLAALLSACAPLPTERTTPAQGDAVRAPQASSRTGAELLAKMAPPPLRPDRMKDPAKAMQERLYELEWPEVDQQGVASWYGPGFHGRKTANGERFNQYELTAAHPTYEFGTQLCVRSKSTGQAVVVRVNDRGPFVKNRVIDLSKAAAEEIGMLGKGVKSVEIYKLDEGEDSCPEALLAASN
ncbi:MULTISPECIES: septal ring lytic transglycosylase RlpA family protein [Comamonas]|uniref:septal ring lytic transglycosylase RlpA family protein n=1 Tax=Comamonas TaxID=283 RepID=UPI00257B121B|nr:MULTISPECIES: septal ring lytic transglycosylase RlpA family protein [Comamonas]